MKILNKISATVGFVSMYLFVAVKVFGESGSIIPEEAPLINVDAGTEVNAIVRWIIIVLVAVGVMAALIFLIWGAIKWIISGGDKEKVSEARGTIIAAIIGLVVLLLAVVILNFVMGILGVGSVLDPNIPDLQCYLNARGEGGADGCKAQTIDTRD